MRFKTFCVLLCTTIIFTYGAVILSCGNNQTTPANPVGSGSNGKILPPSDDIIPIPRIPIWWDLHWYFAKKLSIDEPLGNYQMLLTVYREDGHDDLKNGILDCEGHCRPDFSDLRFISSDGHTELPHWIETTSTDGMDNFARIWVKTAGEDELYVYYGNPHATSTGNGYETFVFFDDFESFNQSVWEERNPSAFTITANDGLLHVKYGTIYGGTSAGIHTREYIPSDGIIAVKMKGERGANSWNQPICLNVAVDSINWMYNRYRHVGSQELRYHRHFRTMGTGYLEQYCPDVYPSLEWRILYFKKLTNWQAAGTFTDYFDGNRLGFESTGNYAINGDFIIKLYTRTFNSNLNIYYDWVFVAKYAEKPPYWDIASSEMTPLR
jgi:hypothetical protein